MCTCHASRHTAAGKPRQPQERKPTGVAFSLAVIITQSALLLLMLGDFGAWLHLLKMYTVLVMPMACGLGMALMQLQHYVVSGARVQGSGVTMRLATALDSTLLGAMPFTSAAPEHWTLNLTVVA